MAEELYSILYSSNWGFFFKQKNMHDYKSALRMKMHWLYLLRAPSHNQLKSNAFTMIFFILQYIAIYSREYCVELYLARHSQANSPILKIFKEYFSSSSTWDSIIKWKKIFKKVGDTCEWVYNYIHDKYYLKFKLLTITDLLTGSYIHLALLKIIWCFWIHNNFLNYYSFKYL